MSRRREGSQASSLGHAQPYPSTRGTGPAWPLRENYSQGCPNQVPQESSSKAEKLGPIPILNTVLNKMNTAFSTFGIASVACLRLSSDETLLNAGL